MTDTATPTPETITGELVRSRVPEPLLPMDIGSATQAMNAYQETCRRLLDTGDWQGPPGQDGSFVKRRGWSKLGTFYGVSTELVGGAVVVDRDGDGKPVRARATVRATHRNGRHEEASGACSIDEARFASDKAQAKIAQGKVNVEHDLPATAETRARNRAIANLIGFGAVSAEEVDGDSDGGGGGAPPEWARPADDVKVTADALIDVLSAAGIANNQEAVLAIGEDTFKECGNTIPVCVEHLVARIATALKPAATAPETGPFAKAAETASEDTP